jgi:hypothetical protein
MIFENVFKDVLKVYSYEQKNKTSIFKKSMMKRKTFFFKPNVYRMQDYVCILKD